MVGAQALAPMRRPFDISQFKRDGRVKQGMSPRRVRRALKARDLRRMSLPKAYWESHSRHIQDPAARKVFARYGQQIVDMVETAAGLFITGEQGVGKTGAATGVLKEAVRWGFSGYFVTHDELRELRLLSGPTKK